jgi:hypothetical protein
MATMDFTTKPQTLIGFLMFDLFVEGVLLIINYKHLYSFDFCAQFGPMGIASDNHPRAFASRSDPPTVAPSHDNC